ncbi:MAG: hypothetical protein NUV81_00305 [bacterium]|nr:hypothetical protein [bacterium]
MKSKNNKTVKELIRDHEKIEHDLGYWLEHVSHWALLLFASILSVFVISTFF